LPWANQHLPRRAVSRVHPLPLRGIQLGTLLVSLGLGGLSPVLCPQRPWWRVCEGRWGWVRTRLLCLVNIYRARNGEEAGGLGRRVPGKRPQGQSD
jgi:hypothetical protein